MPDDEWAEFVSSGHGPRFDYSSAAAAEILNLHFDPSQPKAVLFSKILYTILHAMQRADEALQEARYAPSAN
jgi:hypothetical protein